MEEIIRDKYLYSGAQHNGKEWCLQYPVCNFSSSVQFKVKLKAILLVLDY